MKKIILTIAVMFVFTACLFGGDRLYLSQEQVNFTKTLVNEDLLKIEYNLNRIHISDILWNNIDYQAKKDFSASMAIYCGNKKMTYLYWVDIYSKDSGKKLAKFSQSYGFKIY